MHKKSCMSLLLHHLEGWQQFQALFEQLNFDRCILPLFIKWYYCNNISSLCGTIGYYSNIPLILAVSAYNTKMSFVNPIFYYQIVISMIRYNLLQSFKKF